MADKASENQGQDKIIGKYFFRFWPYISGNFAASAPSSLMVGSSTRPMYSQYTSHVLSVHDSCTRSTKPMYCCRHISLATMKRPPRYASPASCLDKTSIDAKSFFPSSGVACPENNTYLCRKVYLCVDIKYPQRETCYFFLSVYTEMPGSLVLFIKRK